MSKGVKFDEEKLQWHLLPLPSIQEVIKRLMFGAKRYPEADNWKRVEGARWRYYDAALRHITAWWEGEIRDPDGGQHHLAAAVCCLLFLMWFDFEEEKEK